MKPGHGHECASNFYVFVYDNFSYHTMLEIETSIDALAANGW